MVNQREVYIDGEYRPWNEANVHIMSHSFGRGSAIFEVIGFHETQAGPAIFRLDEYLSRFWQSASLLEMELPLLREELQAAVVGLVKRSGLRSGFLKLYGFYPEISYAILPPQRRCHVAVCIFSEEDLLGGRKTSPNPGVTACVSRWHRLDPRSVPIEAKVAANYVNGMVARMEARQRGFDYAILLDVQGFLAEGGTESLFLVREGRLLTPSLGTVLQSITRKSILTLAGGMGLHAVEGCLSPELLNEADEVFFAGTVSKCIPVRQVGDRSLGQTPGPVTRRLAERLAAITAGRDVSFAGWLTPCG
jgi:branched-chain amino acid aminotransferase